MDNTEDKDARWRKLEEIVRVIVREECERIHQNILAVLEKHDHAPKAKVAFINGTWVGISSVQLETWRAAYGAVDVETELSKAAAWLVANPKQNPKNQFARFLNAWLSRSQNQSSIRSIPTRNEPESRKLCSYCSKVATAAPNRIWACDDHTHEAMDQKPVPMFKNPVTAKPVSGS